MLTPERVDAQSTGYTASRPLSRSNAYLRALDLLDRLARYDVPVLIEGESGTGKTLLARRVHDRSPRAGGPYHKVALSGVADTLVESELFGHVAGAYTDAQSHRAGAFVTAHSGTLCLDEFGKASPRVQACLIDALEARKLRHTGADREMPVDVRVVAMTNVALPTLVAAGSFLPDLDARFQPFTVHLPPLRDRRADIPELTLESLRRYARLCGYPELPVIDPALMRAFLRAPWPNNVRQLDFTVWRMLIDAEGAGVITLGMLEAGFPEWKGDGVPPRSSVARRPYRNKRERGGTADAARKLGVHRVTIWRRMHRQNPGDQGVQGDSGAK
jgi:DNA-binding NtrC family response regulator